MNFKTLSLIGAALLATLPTLSQAEEASPWLASNTAIVNKHILPRYQQLSDSSQALEQQAKALCDNPSDATLEATREAFHTTMDAWVGVQHLRFGPIELFSRYHRFQLWPDKHNTGTKQLAQLLADQDESKLEAKAFFNSSVAVQGLSAMERLLFGSKVTTADFGTQGKPSYTCKLTIAIAHNLADQSAGVLKDWQHTPPPFQFMARNTEEMLDSEDTHLGERKDVLIGFYNNLYTELQSVIDQKLVRPMGEGGAKVKPRHLESWRSERSLRNISINIEALASLYTTGFAPLVKEKDAELDKKIKLAFRSCYQASTAIAPPLYKQLKNEKARATLEHLLKTLRELQALITGPMAESIDFPLGFNALDGD